MTTVTGIQDIAELICLGFISRFLGCIEELLEANYSKLGRTRKVALRWAY